MIRYIILTILLILTIWFMPIIFLALGIWLFLALLLFTIILLLKMVYKKMKLDVETENILWFLIGLALGLIIG